MVCSATGSILAERVFKERCLGEGFRDGLDERFPSWQTLTRFVDDWTIQNTGVISKMVYIYHVSHVHHIFGEDKDVVI